MTRPEGKKINGPEKVGEIVPRVMGDALKRAKIPPEAIPSGVDSVYVIPIDIPKAQRKEKALEVMEIIRSAREQDA